MCLKVDNFFVPTSFNTNTLKRILELSQAFGPERGNSYYVFSVTNAYCELERISDYSTHLVALFLITTQ